MGRWAMAGCIALVAVMVAGEANAKKKKKNQEPDRMGLAQLMLADGFPERAEALLEKIDPNEDEKLDKALYYKLRGLAAQKLDKYEDAAKYFGQTVAAGDTTPAIHRYWANALMRSEQLDAALEVLTSAPPAVYESKAAYLLEAQIQLKRENKNGAFFAMEKAVRKFPDDLALKEKRVQLLTELGLYVTALEAGREVLSSGLSSPDFALSLAEAMKRAGQPEKAIEVLEQASLRYPYDENIRRVLASAYLDLGRPLTAGNIMYELALQEPEDASRAAELYRRARAFERAERMNSKVLEQKTKIKQRLSLLIEQEHYEAAASLDRRISRLGLLEEQSVAYALAYAHYQTGNFDRVNQLLARITDSQLFKQATELRRVMEVCAKQTWRCQ